MTNEDIRHALETRRTALAEAVVARHYELTPDSWLRYGSAGREKSVRDAGYHLTYLSEAIGVSAPRIFFDYVTWLQVLFAGLGFPSETVAVVLECMRHVIRRDMAADVASVTDEYLQLAEAQLRVEPVATASFIRPDGYLGSLAKRYLASMLRGERHAAIELIFAAIEDGVAVQDIYLHVFQPTQHEIGRLWQTNQISVAQEHFCTAVTQLAMAQLYPHIFSTESTGRSLVIACVSGELHEIGAHILADLFEMEGWDSFYLGANTPPTAVVETVVERDPDLLAISATMSIHVGAVADMIARVREAMNRHLPIMVGGYPFNVAPDLWRQIGAEGTAPNALQAISVASELLEEEPR
jgi:methanogenic corrinoid protein MtbC1